MTADRTGNSENALETIRKIMHSDDKSLRAYLYKNILLNSIRCQGLDILDLKIIDRAVAEFQHAACVFQPYRSLRKVSIFGSARTEEGSPYYQLAVEFGRLVTKNGLMVITGAAEGIMKAGIEGAGSENSFGVSILLPFEQRAARIIQDDPKLVTFKYFFTRKIFFVMEADAVALFPGGFGTHDEGFEVLTLLQTGKTPPMPVVLLELPGERYWEAWDQFIRQQLLARGYISPEDLSFYKIVHSPEEGDAWIQSYYSTYHSMRQVRDTLVIRLEKEMTDGQIMLLNNGFSDLLRSGRIYKTSALPEEKDEPSLLCKPRIAFSNTRKSAGRLNQMILMINELGSRHAVHEV